MDSLENLPISDEESSSNQDEIMDKYFGSLNEQKGNKMLSSKWALVGYATLFFIILANPWSQSLINKLPYFGGNDMTLMIFSAVLFVLFMIIVVLFNPIK